MLPSTQLLRAVVNRIFDFCVIITVLYEIIQIIFYRIQRA